MPGRTHHVDMRVAWLVVDRVSHQHPVRGELVSNEVFDQPYPGVWGGTISDFFGEGAFKFPKDGSVLPLLRLVNVLPKVLRIVFPSRTKAGCDCGVVDDLTAFGGAVVDVLGDWIDDSRSRAVGQCAQRVELLVFGTRVHLDGEVVDAHSAPPNTGRVAPDQ